MSNDISSTQVNTGKPFGLNIKAIELSSTSFERLRKRCCEVGPLAALEPQPRESGPCEIKITGEVEAHITRLACAQPPERYASFVATMEDVLEVYQRPQDPMHPLVCLDEFAKPLLSETRVPRRPSPGRLAKYDSEYVREGSTTGFMLAMPHPGKRDAFFSAGGRRTARQTEHPQRSVTLQSLPTRKSPCPL